LFVAEPIAEDYRTVVCPFIDVIDYENFQYRAQDEGARGAFDWEFFYKRLPITENDKKHPAEPFELVFVVMDFVCCYFVCFVVVFLLMLFCV
jgi:hypothetical protein